MLSALISNKNYKMSLQYISLEKFMKIKYKILKIESGYEAHSCKKYSSL